MEIGSTHRREGPGNAPRIQREDDLLVARGAAEEGRTIVLVEGLSDKAALDALAKRRGRTLHDEGIVTIPIGGATKIWGFLDLLGPLGLNAKLTGLCDIGEERHFRRALQRAGFGSNSY
jgi:hypothetical protein